MLRIMILRGNPVKFVNSKKRTEIGKSAPTAYQTPAAAHDKKILTQLPWNPFQCLVWENALRHNLVRTNPSADLGAPNIPSFRGEILGHCLRRKIVFTFDPFPKISLPDVNSQGVFSSSHGSRKITGKNRSDLGANPKKRPDFCGMLFDQRWAAVRVAPKDNPPGLTSEGGKLRGIQPVDWFVLHIQNREPSILDRGFSSATADPVLNRFPKGSEQPAKVDREESFRISPQRVQMQPFKIVGGWENAKIEHPATMLLRRRDHVGEKNQFVAQTTGLVCKN